MPIEQNTTARTESDLEAEIHRALAVAFPWISASDLKHQLKFSIKFGHAVVEIDGLKTYAAYGRGHCYIREGPAVGRVGAQTKWHPDFLR